MMHRRIQNSHIWIGIVCAITALTSTIHAQDLDLDQPASIAFSNENDPAEPDFQKHVVPLLGRLGCNAAKCHGSFQGQGGFQLSLFGFDFNSDHRALTGFASSAEGMRIDTTDPDNSLILLKGTAQIDHEGGEPFKVDSWEYQLLRQWIAQGAADATESVTKEPDPETRLIYSTEHSDFFENKIRPLLESHCYECHGYANSKAQLRVTLREELLEGGESGPAIVPGDLNASLIVHAVRYRDDGLKMPPSGRLDDDEIALFEQWVRIGAPWSNPTGAASAGPSRRLKTLRYEPEEILFAHDQENAQIRVIAEWSDGTREDVTCLSRFQTNNDGVARVDRDGRVTSTGEGDTNVVVFYDNGVSAIPVLRRYTTSSGSNVASVQIQADHPIDKLVNEKLRKTGLSPSELCSDAEFLRRVSIDMTGTLPTPDEVRAFLLDEFADKRLRKIDELLARPTYAAWWANKLCDFTGCNPTSIRSLLEVAQEEGYVKASQWYDWIYERVDRNQPYDELVEGIMLASLASRDDGMPVFWTRQSLKEPKDTAMSVAHAFLGIQLQCAECHKHPFDQWTQYDFDQFSSFFTTVTRTKRRVTFDEDKELSLLRNGMVFLEEGEDPRVPVMEWMRDKNNPWFARAFVNRVWAGYFHVGIVNPPDQFTPANPPSNPQLLDWLTEGFIDNDYDMKWLHRQIASSDTYQRSWVPNESNRDDLRNFSRAIPRRIPAEVIYDALKQATAGNDEMETVRTNLRRRASGHLSMRMAGTHAMRVFGKPDRSLNCDCERVNEPTLLQSIFVQNDPLVRMRLADSNWIYEIEELQEDGVNIDRESLVEQVWLRSVGRLPRASEMDRSLAHLESVDSLAEGVTDLLWAMLNTKEFLLNH